MHRSHTCGELTVSDTKKEVVLAGWVSNRRDHGGIIFIDLRDRYGLTQIVFDPADSKEAWETANDFRSEYVIQAKWTVRNRPEGQANPNLVTGEIEVIITSVKLLSASKTPPFELDEHGTEVNEETRFKYRYLDIRRTKIRDFIKFRSHMTTFTRNWFTARDFLDVQTPILANSSPEGARDFLVPSRLHPGKFYALPQAPQQFKQLLMVGGIDKYFQIAPCFRDEDPRADRHAGDFYQIDCEMSFIEQHDVFNLVEDYIFAASKELSDKKIITQNPGKDVIRENGKFFILSYDDSLEKYGTDKPDLRFGLSLVDVADIFARSSNEIFSGIAADRVKNRVKALRVPNGDNIFSKTQMKGFEDFVRKHGAKGLGYFQMTEEGLKGPLNKFFTEADLEEIITRTELQVGDAVFFGAGEKDITLSYMGKFRNHLADLIGLRDITELAFCWITDFPMFERDEATGKIDFSHNPFSMPQSSLEGVAEADLLKIKAFQYDLACNGYEILSGSIRNHSTQNLVNAFKIVWRDEAEVKEKFGAMYEAFQYGVPPHGGFAIGMDRLMMIYLDESNIRDIYAFPKSGKAQDVMMNSPMRAEAPQLKELWIDVVELD
jgi:aspartyl-tRNA synthetase